jgi:hypothetical protein
VSAPASSPHEPSSLTERLLSVFARALVARPGLWLLGALLSLVPALWLTSRLEVHTSFIDLLSHDDPEVVALDRVLDESGGLGFSLIAIPSEDRPRAERVAIALDERLPKLNGVRFVQARTDVKFFEDRKLYYLDAPALEDLARATKESIDYRIMKETDLLLEDEPPPDPFERIRKEASSREQPIPEFLVGKDGKYLYVLIGLTGSVADLEPSRIAQAEIEREASAIAATEGLTPRFTGPLVNRREDDRTLKEDLGRAGTLGLAVVLALVLASTRKPRWVLFLGVPLTIGLAWTFAFAFVAVHGLNALSGFLVSILSGLGIEYGIHLGARYREERRDGHTPDAAMLRVIPTTGGALFAACVVNAAVFAVVAVTGFRGFMEFGLIASVGMLLTMAATFVTLPALVLVVERRWPGSSRAERPMRPLVVPAVVRWGVVALTPILAAVSAWLLVNGTVAFRTDWRELGADTPASRFDAYVTETLGPSSTQAMLYLDDPGEVSEARAAIEAVRASRKSRGLPFQLVSLTGIEDLVPKDTAPKAAAIAKLRHQLGRIKPSMLSEEERSLFERAKVLAAQQPFTSSDIPASIRSRFATVDGTGTLAVIHSDAILEESDAIIDWADQIGEVRAELGRRKVRGVIASENEIAGGMFRRIEESGARVLFATFAVLFAVLFVEFRRLSRAFAVLSSVAVGMLLLGGGMALFRVDLNFMNVAILPIAIGLCLDNAMHLFHRYVEEGPGSMPFVLRRTGVAAVVSSATNAAGFASLLVARHGGLRSVAVLSVIGIVATLFSTTVFFPLALETIEKLRPRAPKTT